MEYFAKFTRLAASKKPPPTAPATHLPKFEKAWKSVQNICYYQSKWRDLSVALTPLPTQLGIMVDLLVQEDIRQADADDSTTGACMEYLLDNDVLDELVKLAVADVPVGVRGVVISNLSTFVNLTDDKLLVQKAVHNPILALLRAYLQPDSSDLSQSVNSLFDASQHAYDDEFVDLMYALCSKIRGEPMLLNIFFQDRRWLRSLEQHCLSSESIPALNKSVVSLKAAESPSLSVPSPTSSTYEFILFSHLLRFVHIEGKAGDTARTSLLFLLELATTEIMASNGGNTALERFILDDSGFAPLLAASLGALYSQLPRSLTLSASPAAIVPESFPSYTADLQNAIESSIFAASGARERNEDRGTVSSTNPEFRSRLAWFAQLLGFIQDVLFRCPSAAICNEVLHHLTEHFLKAILYPSLLESSDTDGSCIAVMVYLELMLSTARHEDLAAAIMEFLTEEPNAPPPDQQGSCLPFTLRDLIYTNLQSTVSNDAVIAALNLLRLVLSKHCRYTSRLMELEKITPSSSSNVWMMNCTVAIDVHRQELEMYARLMGQLEGTPRSSRTDHDGLYIPWRREAAQQPSNRRALVPESFVIGYDEYLEDAAHEWEAHEAYHIEIDALAQVQRTRDRLKQGKLPPMAKSVSAAASPSAKHMARPRKYSEAVMMAPAASRTAASDSASYANTPAAYGGDCGGSINKPKLRSKWRVKQSDPIVRVLMSLLARYFAQPRECNLALTGVLAALVGCPHRTLDPWLGFNLSALVDGVLAGPWQSWLDNLRNLGNDTDDSDSDGDDETTVPAYKYGAPAAAIMAADSSKFIGLDKDLQDAVRALPHGAAPPALYVVVSGLAQQAMVLRNEVPGFDSRLKRARNALMGIVEDADALDMELESSESLRSSPMVRHGTVGRDRGLSSASLEQVRAILPPLQPPPVRRDSLHPDSRPRAGSASQASENDASSVSAKSAVQANPLAGSWQALSVPPKDANIAEFLENVIILQESIKEIIARVQVRRENGGDEDAIV